MRNTVYGSTNVTLFRSIKKMNLAKSFSPHSDGKNRSDGNISYEVVVVGAGVAGSALAYALGKDGRRVHVIERNLKEPDRIVGELLQPAGYLKLLELGLSDCVRDIDAQKMVGYAVLKDGKSIELPYPLEDYDSDVTARAFHHGRFVRKLREKAASLPKYISKNSVNLQQGNVTSLIEDNGEIKGVRYKMRDGQESTTYASLTVVCDGGFSNLRKFLANPKVDKPSYTAGLILENCQIPHPNSSHLIFGDRVSGIFYPISSTEVRFFTDIPGPKVPSVSNGQMAHFLRTVMAPQVPPEMYSAFISAVDKGDIRIMPISSMRSSPCLKQGAVLVGDALNMRHVITGAGMTVALHDVSLLCDLLRHRDLHDTSSITKCTQDFYHIRKPMAFTMNVMADSLYQLIFSSPEETRKVIQQACFKYMSLGGSFSSGPVGLVSGLNPHPSKIMLNLFGMAIYTFGSMLLPIPSPRRVYAAARLALDAASTVVPIILKEV